MFKIVGDDVFFSSGRSFYANNGIVALSERKDGSFKFTYGYDGGLPEFEALTSEERHELADYFIALWEKWKNE